ncbi:hypothetical protein Ahy_B06g082678 [Arachis hypogaea]|uniref:Uncharacterized protein n=1 Tax=Arachis hypogaea TaxID=3818 RepID=A0A444YNZ0_ARAHY|nr:hypothetical protein Ahy_B06g082678 [Arachis hypogaea]
MPSYIKYMKELLTKKSSLKGGQTIVMNKECSALIQPELPTKRKDPGSFHIPCAIGETMFDKGLCDLEIHVVCNGLARKKRHFFGIKRNFYRIFTNFYAYKHLHCTGAASSSCLVSSLIAQDTSPNLSRHDTKSCVFEPLRSRISKF